MLLDRVTVATITWARTDEEQQTLRASMLALCRIGRPIFVADGGSGPDFCAYLRSLPNVTPVLPERAGVVGQTRACLRAALSAGCAFVVYTESDKQRFLKSTSGPSSSRPLMTSSLASSSPPGTA
jgi:hypothetical protein